MRHPLFMGLLRQPFIQEVEHILQISHKRRVRADVFVDLRRIDVDMKDLCPGSEGLHIPDHPVGEAGSQGHKKVAAAHAQVGGLGPVHADHSGIAGIGPVKGSLSHQGIADRSVQKTREGAHLLRCAGKHGSASHIQKRTLCRLKELQRFLQLRFRKTVLMPRLFRLHRGVFAHRRRHILGHIHQHRSRAA